MSSHHRSGGPPSLMDDVHDFVSEFFFMMIEDVFIGLFRIVIFIRIVSKTIAVVVVIAVLVMEVE